jgi:tRNA A-37 threonylcarbamoyl transferase component Bud32
MLEAEEMAQVVRERLGLSACRPAGLLRERPGRTRVVALDTSAGLLVAKVTVQGGATRSAGALDALAAVPHAQLHPLRTPLVRLHDPARHLLVYEYVPGDPLADRIAAGQYRVLERAGRAVARLHGAPVTVGPPRGFAGHLADLVRPRLEVLAVAFPALAGQVDHLQGGLVRAAGETRGHFGPVHRDLHPRQLLISTDIVYLVDWDMAAQSDPALDVGNLRAYLRHQLPAALAELTVASFERGYVETGDPAVVERAKVYEALSFVRLACKRYRLNGPSALPVVQRLLNSAELLLTEEIPRARA